MKHLLLLTIITLPASAQIANGTLARLKQQEPTIQQFLKETELPGATIALIPAKGTPTFRTYRGNPADIPELGNTPLPVVTPETVQNIASLSKAFVMISLMQWVEAGIVDIDQPINEAVINTTQGQQLPLLDFPLQNPHYPKASITLRMLMEHTSSICDDWEFFRMFYYLPNDTSPKYEFPRNQKQVQTTPLYTLGGFLKAYLVQMDELNQSLHASPASWLDQVPGGTFNYSDINASLTGYIVGRLAYHLKNISPQPGGMGKYADAFQAYTQAHIFKPLGMNTASWVTAPTQNNGMWFYTETNPFDQTTRVLTSVEPNLNFPFFPSGGLNISLVELSRAVQAMLGQGTYTAPKGEKVQLIKATTFQKVLRQTWSFESRKQSGFFTFHSVLSHPQGVHEVYHPGEGQGSLGMFGFFPEHQLGYAYLIDGRQKIPPVSKLDLAAILTQVLLGTN